MLCAFHNQAFVASDFDDDFKDTISDIETLSDDKQSLSDTVPCCDTEKMLKEIGSPNTSDSLLSLESITGSNIDSNTDNDIGEAASSRGCASHYFNPNGVDNSSVQAQQCDSGNSIIDNDVSPTDEGSSTKM